MQSSEQQTKFDDFLEEFNNERPHQALDIECPAEVYTPSTRPYRGLTELDYPFHDKTIHVTRPVAAAFIRTRRDLKKVPGHLTHVRPSEANFSPSNTCGFGRLDQ